MYENGQRLTTDTDFQDHIEHEVPVQIYWNEQHKDIGFIQYYTRNFVRMNNTYYSRQLFTFISRPGY